MFRVFASHLHSERFWFNFRRTYSKHPILPPSILFSGKHVDAFTPTVTSPLSNAERLKLLADPRVFIVKPGQNLPPLVTARGIYPDIGHHQAASTHLKPYEMVLKRIFEKEDPIVIKPTYEVHYALILHDIF